MAGGRVVVIDVVPAPSASSVNDGCHCQEPESPAERAGVRVGELLVEVDGEATRNMTGQELAAAIRGPEKRLSGRRKGTQVEFALEIQDHSHYETSMTSAAGMPHTPRATHSLKSDAQEQATGHAGLRFVTCCLRRERKDHQTDETMDEWLQVARGACKCQLKTVGWQIFERRQGIAGTTVSFTIDTDVHDYLFQDRSMNGGPHVAMLAPPADVFACIHMFATRRVRDSDDGLRSSPQLYLNHPLVKCSTNKENQEDDNYAQSKQVFQRIVHLRMIEDEDRSRLQVTEKLWEEIVSDEHVNLLVCVRADANEEHKATSGQMLLKMKPSRSAWHSFVFELRVFKRSAMNMKMELRADNGAMVESIDMSLAIRDDECPRLRSIISVDINEDLGENKIVDDMIRQILEEHANFSSVEREGERISIKNSPNVGRSMQPRWSTHPQGDLGVLVEELHDQCSSIAGTLDAIAVTASELRKQHPRRGSQNSIDSTECRQMLNSSDGEDRHEQRCAPQSLPLTFATDNRTTRRASENMDDMFESLSKEQLRKVLRVEKENRMILMQDMNRLSEIYDAKYAKLSQANDEKDELVSIVSTRGRCLLFRQISKLKEKLHRDQAEAENRYRERLAMSESRVEQEHRESAHSDEHLSDSSPSTSKSKTTREQDETSCCSDVQQPTQRSPTSSVTPQVIACKIIVYLWRLSVHVQLETSMKLEHSIRRSDSLRQELLNAIDSAQRVMKTFHF
eukprot:760557-Hanusia_phi.AAC.3